jgi:hypothetical protein
MRVPHLAVGAIVILVTTLAATAQPVPNASAWCDLNSNGVLTGRATNSADYKVLCTLSCAYTLASGDKEEFGCIKRPVAAGAKDVNLCKPKSAKAKLIKAGTKQSCVKAP